jgi:hypothetical protein
MHTANGEHSVPSHSMATGQVPQSTTNPSMARFLAQLRAARTPAQTQHNFTPSTLPGAYPMGHPADDDWETITEISEDDTILSTRTPMPQVPPVQQPAYNEGVSYQGIPQMNPVYQTFQRAYAQAANCVPTQYGRPAYPFAPMS